MHCRSNRVLAAVTLAVFITHGVSAASVSWQGALKLSPGAANDTATYKFAVSAMSTISIQSYGYNGSSGAPGGTNLAGRVISSGGFDPYITVFKGSGPSATFLASSDDGPCLPPNGNQCPDSSLSLTLSPGAYTLVVEAFDNMSLAENLGTGTLGDGFTGLGNYDATRTNNFAIDIGGRSLDTIFADGFE